MLLLLVIVLVAILIVLLQSDRFGGLAAGSEPTPTVQVAGITDPEPTATATATATEVSDEEAAVDPEPSPTDEASPTATPTPPDPTPTPPEPTETPDPEPTPTETEAPPEAPDTPDEPPEEEPPPGRQRDTPFDGRFVPPQWVNGRSISLGSEQLIAGGASEPEGGEFPGAEIVERVDVEFEGLENPSEYIGITIAAMRTSTTGETPIRLSLNGNTIWSGPAPFADGEWTEIGWSLGNLGWLSEGVNILTIEVLSTGESILVSNATVFYG